MGVRDADQLKREQIAIQFNFFPGCSSRQQTMPLPAQATPCVQCAAIAYRFPTQVHKPGIGTVNVNAFGNKAILGKTGIFHLFFQS